MNFKNLLKLGVKAGVAAGAVAGNKAGLAQDTKMYIPNKYNVPDTNIRKSPGRKSGSKTPSAKNKSIKIDIQQYFKKTSDTRKNNKPRLNSRDINNILKRAAKIPASESKLNKNNIDYSELNLNSIDNDKSMDTKLAFYMKELIIQCVLVNEDVRPAYLIQKQAHGDNGGKASNNNSTLLLLSIVKKYFPNLIISENYDGYQGILISKKSYDNTKIGTNQMGEILGYPCNKEYDDLDRDKLHYSKTIDIYFNNIRDSNSLITNVCKDNTTYTQEFENITKNANIALKKKEYHKIFKGNNIEFKFNIQEIIPTKVIINDIINGNTLSEEKIEKIDEEILGLFSEYGKETIFYSNFSPNNPYHNGILLVLLENDRNSPEDFYRGELYTSKRKELQDIIDKEGDNLVSILNATENNNEDNDISKLNELLKHHQSIILQLLSNMPINKCKMHNLLNSFRKIGISEDFCNYFRNNFQYNNPTHVGILLGILIKNMSINKKLDLFQNLSEYEYNELKTQSNSTMKKLETSIMDIMNQTKE